MTNCLRSGWLLIAVILCFGFANTLAQGELSPINFKSEADQVSFTLRKEFLPAISHISIEVFTPEIKKIHQQVVPADQSLIWKMKEMSRYAEGNTYLFICAVRLKPVNGEAFVLPGRIMQVGKNLEFQLLEQRPDNLPGPAPVEFHKAMTETMPNNGAAWFFYALAICDKHRDEFGIPAISLAPSPPPPPAAPGPYKEIPLTKEELKQIAEEDKKWEAKKAAFQKDLKIAQPAFLKAAELADDCQIKDAAMSYLAAAASEFDDQEQERKWVLKRIESPCSTNTAKAESYFLLAVKQWSCAYQLTEKYAKPGLKATDPFHFRSLNAKDKKQFDACLSSGFEYLEKALNLNPEYPDALFYKSLMYREKQKTTPDPVQRKKIGEEATKITNLALEITKKGN